MRSRVHVVVIACMLFFGCGSDSNSDPGFVNQTQHPDSQPWGLWKAAAKPIATD
jgi:hypothetical protein